MSLLEQPRPRLRRAGGRRSASSRSSSPTRERARRLDSPRTSPGSTTSRKSCSRSERRLAARHVAELVPSSRRSSSAATRQGRRGAAAARPAARARARAAAPASTCACGSRPTPDAPRLLPADGARAAPHGTRSGRSSARLERSSPARGRALCAGRRRSHRAPRCCAPRRRSRARSSLELIGRHANLVLLDGAGASLTRSCPPPPTRAGGPGRLAPGTLWRPPPGSRPRPTLRRRSAECLRAGVRRQAPGDAAGDRASRRSRGSSRASSAARPSRGATAARAADLARASSASSSARKRTLAGLEQRAAAAERGRARARRTASS